MSTEGNLAFIVLMFVTNPHKNDMLYLYIKLEIFSLELFVHRNNIHKMKLISQFGKLNGMWDLKYMKIVSNMLIA